MNPYIMVIMKYLLSFLDNSHYGCFMITIMKDFLDFLDNSHYGCFMITIMKDFSIFLYMYRKPINGPHFRFVKVSEEIQLSPSLFIYFTIKGLI